MATNYFSIDHLIVYVSLFITLIIGIHSGKGIKTMKEYVTANKTFGTTSLVLTYLATNLSAETVIRLVAMIFSDGIIMFVALLGLVLGDVIQAFFIAPHAVYFPDCITMGDIMRKLYGRTSGIIAGFLGLLSAMFITGLELVVLGMLCESLLGIPAPSAILVGGLILTLYSAHGGIKSVVATDLLQFCMIMVGIPMIVHILFYQVGGLDSLLSKVPQEKWIIADHPKSYFYMILFLLWSIFPACKIDAATMQRLLMGKSQEQLRKQYLIVAGVQLAFQSMLLLIALAGIVLYPDGQGYELIPSMIHDFFPTGFKGIAILGFLAMLMSTIDSYLHVTGVTLVHDIIKPIYAASGRLLLQHQEKTLAQWATLLVGIVAIGIGMYTKDMSQLLLASLEATGPLLMFPLLSGMMGLKPEKPAFYIAMVVTIAAWISCKFYLPEDQAYHTTLLCMVVNGIAFFGIHLYINRGFKRVKQVIIRPLSSYTLDSL